MAMGAPIVGTRVNCGRPDHISPFKAFADVVLGLVTNYIVWAGRSGSKTYIFGGFDTLYKSLLYPGYSTSVLGGSEDQSRQTARAMEDLLERTGRARDLLSVYPMPKERIGFKNKSEVTILPASKKSTRGPHTVSLKLDEVDEIEPEVYANALSIPQSLRGYPSVTGRFSTNHHDGGMMDQAITRAADQGDVVVYRYCVLESLESCETAGYECSTCFLAPRCPGTHMKQADGYYRMDDFKKKMMELSEDELDRDWFCIKSGKGDRVYEHEYREDVNLVNVPLDPGAPVTLSLDWGGTDPYSLGVWQKAPRTSRFPDGSWIRKDEIYLTSVDGSAHNGILIKLARKCPWWKMISEVVYDNARPDQIAEWKIALRDRAVHYIPSNKKDIQDGIDCVKGALCPALGAPRLYINSQCSKWRWEVTRYRQRKVKDSENDWVIVDKDNHAMDETRYFCKEKFKKEEPGFFGTADWDQTPNH